MIGSGLPLSPKWQTSSCFEAPPLRYSMVGLMDQMPMLAPGKRFRPLSDPARRRGLRRAGRPGVGCRLRHGDGPRRLAGPRRSALHGRRTPAPRPAHHPPRLWRGRRDPGLRRPAHQRLRGGHRRRGPDAADRSALVASLAEAVGFNGLVAGQARDLSERNRAAHRRRARRPQSPQDRRADDGRGRGGGANRRRLAGAALASWASSPAVSAWPSRSATT